MQVARNLPMEVDDPFGFISDCCHISSSQEEILRNYGCFEESEQPCEGESQNAAGGPGAVESTGLFMVSPLESTQAARNDGITPQETYHTPPEEAAPSSSTSGEGNVVVHRGCPDSERAINLGSDSDPGLAERRERAVSRLHGSGPRPGREKAAGLERSPGLDKPLSKKPRLWGNFEGSRACPAEKMTILEINMRLETPSSSADIVKEKIKENLEKTVDSLKNYGSTFLREIKIREGTLKSKLNFSLVLDSSPKIIDFEIEDRDGDLENGGNKLEQEDDALEFKQAGRHSAEVGGCTDVAQMDSWREGENVANIANFRYGEEKDLHLCDKGKAIAQHESVFIGGKKPKAQTCDHWEGQRCTEKNNGFQNSHKFKGGVGPTEAVTSNRRSVTDAAGTGADVAQAVESADNVQKFRCDGNKDPCMHDKRKPIADCVETSRRSGEMLKVQPCDYRVPRSAALNPPKAKDGSGNKEAVRGNAGSLTDGETLGVAGRDHRRDEIRESIAGRGEFCMRGGDKLKAQGHDNHQGKRSSEINSDVARMQNTVITGNNVGNSSDADEGLPRLPSCFQNLAQNVPGREISEASSCQSKAKKFYVYDILKRLAGISTGHSVMNGSVLDVAKKHGMTFPS